MSPCVQLWIDLGRRPPRPPPPSRTLRGLECSTRAPASEWDGVQLTAYNGIRYSDAFEVEIVDYH
jgi:hypothetical protein